MRQSGRNAVSRSGLDLERMRVRELHPRRHAVHAALEPGRDTQTAIGEVVATLGKHLDDAVGSVGAIERRRGGALDDLDALHVFARDVREAEPRDHAVHDDQRILAPADARRAAEPQRRLTTGLRRVGNQPHAGDFARLQLVGADTRHGHRQLTAVRRLGDARHDYFLEPQRIGRELEVLLLLAGAERHGAGDRLVPDVARRDHDRLAVHRGRADRQRVGAVGGGDGAEVRVCHHDVGAAQGLTGLRGDLALDDRFLRGQRRGGERECYQCCGHSCGQQRTKLAYAHKLPLV